MNIMNRKSLLVVALTLLPSMSDAWADLIRPKPALPKNVTASCPATQTFLASPTLPKGWLSNGTPTISLDFIVAKVQVNATTKKFTIGCMYGRNGNALSSGYYQAYSGQVLSTSPASARSAAGSSKRAVTVSYK